MNISHMFNKTVNTQRLTESQDSTYSPVSTFSHNITGLKCRIQKKKGFEPVEGGRKFSKISHVLYCASGTDLIMEDIVIYNSQAYNVVDSKKEGNSSTYLKISLEKSDADYECYPVFGTKWIQTIEYDGAAEFNGTVNTLLEYSVDGKLYGSTGGTGELLRWDGIDTWDVVATRYSTERFVKTIIEFEEEIYGSGQSTGGKGLLLKWNGIDAWELMAERTLLTSDSLGVIIVYKDEIYGATTRQSELWKWDGVDTWDLIVPDPTPTGSRGILSMIVFDNGSGDQLYAGTDTGQLYRYDDIDTWDTVAPPSDASDVNNMVVFEGELYSCTQFGDAVLQKWNGTDEWITVTVADAQGQNAFKCLTVYEDNIYVSASPDNLLLQWDGDDNFNIVASNLTPPSGSRSMVDLYVYECKIYGTLGGVTNNYVVYAWE